MNECNVRSPLLRTLAKRDGNMLNRRAMKSLALNVALWIALAIINIAIWRLLFEYFPALSQMAGLALGLTGIVVFYAIYYRRRSCGHGRITEGGRLGWWPHVVGRCPQCGVEV